MISEGKLKELPPQDNINKMYLHARSFLLKKGYMESRIGNFNKRGYEQKYAKESYLKNHEILGLGVGAYSHINGYIFKPSNNVNEYHQAISKGTYCVAKYRTAQLSKNHEMERYITHNLFSESMSRIDYKQQFLIDPVKAFPGHFKFLNENGFVEIDKDSIRISNEGRQRVDNIRFLFCSDFHGSI